MTRTTWVRYDHDDRQNTAPRSGVLVWICDEFHSRGVTVGWFDGVRFRTWGGSVDCAVSWWADIDYPTPPRHPG